MDAILALNAGSSSLKLALFTMAADGRNDARFRGLVEGLGKSPRLVLKDPGGATLAEHDLPRDGHQALLGEVLRIARDHLGADRLAAAGHRVVHGGDAPGPARVDDALLEKLDGLAPLAPLHQGHNLDPIRALRRLEPALPQVACFDTSFHRTMPPVAQRFALPRALEEQGVRRYGAHGLSYEYIATRLPEVSARLAAGRTVVAHLGSGASLCAMAAGRSVDTTMGLTPLDGLVMGTRCGAIDPGVLLYLLRNQGMPASELEDLLYHRSGLLGVSGISADMRDLTASHDPHAREAVDLFVWRLAQETALMTASLAGIDGLVFTGGIGAHAHDIRAAACDRLAWLGVRLDVAANAAGAARISAADSAVEVLMIPTDEELMIARHTRAILEAAS